MVFKSGEFCIVLWKIKGLWFGIKEENVIKGIREEFRCLWIGKFNINCKL